MLHQPLRSPLNFSGRLPGGLTRSSMADAKSMACNRRAATRAILGLRLPLPVRWTASVSWSAKDWNTLNVYRNTGSVKRLWRDGSIVAGSGEWLLSTEFSQPGKLKSAFSVRGQTGADAGLGEVGKAGQNLHLSWLRWLSHPFHPLRRTMGEEPRNPNTQHGGRRKRQAKTTRARKEG